MWQRDALSARSRLCARAARRCSTCCSRACCAVCERAARQPRDADLVCGVLAARPCCRAHAASAAAIPSTCGPDACRWCELLPPYVRAVRSRLLGCPAGRRSDRPRAQVRRLERVADGDGACGWRRSLAAGRRARARGARSRAARAGATARARLQPERACSRARSRRAGTLPVRDRCARAGACDDRRKRG